MSLRKRLIAVIVAVACSLGLALPALPAAAAPAQKPSEVHIVGPAVVIGNRAYVTAIYRCNVSDHLFVSIKQVGSRKRDPGLMEEGSSQLVGETGGGWWIRHPGTDEFTCDGRIHLGRYDIGGSDVEYGFGTLENGKGWLQFCLAVAGQNGADDVEENNHTQWITVIRLV